MRYIITGVILFILLMSALAFSMQPVDTLYMNHSETICHGKTCDQYLLSQMGNKSYNFTIDNVPDICKYANWARCDIS